MSPPALPPDFPPRLVLYDGVCGLCHWLVRLLVRVDRSATLRFAPLQGDTAATLRELYPQIPADVDTVVFFDGSRTDEAILLRSRAVLAACKYLPWPWRMARHLAVIPQPLTDAIYRAVAKVRYRIFGKLESCTVPLPDQRALFLP